MMNRKFLVPLLTGILTVGLLAGCGANKTNETSAVNSGRTSQLHRLLSK